MPTVIVGIDVGTSRSGYSYALVKRPNEIVCDQERGGQLKDLTVRSFSSRARSASCAWPHGYLSCQAVLLNKDLSFVAFGEVARAKYLESDPVKQKEWLYFEKWKMCLYGEDVKERPMIPVSSFFPVCYGGQTLAHSCFVGEQAANGVLVSSVDVFAAALQYFREHALKRLSESSNGTNQLSAIV